MYLLIHNSKDFFSIELPDKFKLVNIASFYSIQNKSDYLYKCNQEEFFSNAVSESLDDTLYSDVKAIIIDKSLGGSGWSRAISLAGHIAFTDYSKCALNKLPIILTDWTNLDLEDPSLKSNVINNVFQTQGFYFRKYEKVFSMKEDKVSGLMKYAIDMEVKRLKSIEIENISISTPNDNSHQATNDWGAECLILNAGYSKEELNYERPKTIYFKYLFKQKINNRINGVERYNLLIDTFKPDLTKAERNEILNSYSNENGETIEFKKLTFRKHLRNNKVLLVDDNWDKGWKAGLELIFGCEVDTIGDFEKVLDFDTEVFKMYDIVFLDLYMPIKTGQSIKKDYQKSLVLLKTLKSKFPQIPIIIFTASNKSWTLDEAQQNGADGMYVKESHEFAGDVSYSKGNFKNFFVTVSKCLDKYKILRPYWETIQKIFEHQMFSNLEVGPRIFKQRIEERLKMFYGLLKKGYDQSVYDEETFFYSDYELAFMTLWSVLNEIQEQSFEKTPLSFPVKDAAGNIYYNHPNRYQSILPGLEKWLYRADASSYIDFYVELDTLGTPKETINSSTGRPSGFFDFKFYSNFKQITVKDPTTKEWIEQTPFFELNGLLQNQTPLKIYEEKIILQIAFIIEKMNPTGKLNFYSSLIELNKIRNSLYLTHGSNTDPNFYLFTEKEKRISSSIMPKDKIKDLFNLVSLLLTGEEHHQLVI